MAETNNYCSNEHSRQFYEIYSRNFLDRLNESERQAELDANKLGDDETFSVIFRLIGNTNTFHLGTDKSGQPTNFDGWPKILRGHNPFATSQEAKRKCCHNYVKLKVAMDILGGTMLATLFLLSMSRDYLLDYGQIRVYNSTTNTNFGFCAHANETYYEDQDKLELLLEFDRYLDIMGGMYNNIFGLGAFFYWATFVNTIGAYPFMAMLRNQDIQLDFFSLLSDPVAQRLKFRAEIDELLKQKLEIVKLARFRGKQYPIYTGELNRRLHYQPNNSCLLVLAKRPNLSKYVCVVDKLFHRIKQGGFVDPVCIQVECMNHLKRRIKLIYTYTIPVALSLIMSTLALNVLVELYVRTSSRLRVTKCKLWAQDAVYTGQHTHLPSLEDGGWRYKLYVEHHRRYPDHTDALGLLELMFKVELPLYATTQVVMTNSLLMLITIPAVAGFNVALSVYGLSSTFFSIWVAQLNKQLLAIRDLLHVNTKIKSNKRARSLVDSVNHEAKRIDEITIAMILTCVNYELFCEKFLAFKIYFDATTNLAVVPSISFVIVTYFVGPLVKSNNNDYIFLIVSGIIINTDAFIVNYLQMSRQIVKLHQTLVRVMGQASDYGLSLSAGLELWRSKLALESQIRDAYSADVLGHHVTMATLFELNIYALLTYLHITKSISGITLASLL